MTLSDSSAAPISIGKDVLAELRSALGECAVVVDPDVLTSYRHDSAALCESTPPAVAVLPTTEADVQAVMAVSARYRVPVVVQG
ncbi:MAG: FAD-binding oxidoreductase, partial [Rhodococcus sp. (in: high G+C Gram-positive bacteria)]